MTVERHTLKSLLEEHPNDRSSIVLDTETTGLNPDEDNILSLAVLDARTMQPLYNSYFWPKGMRSWHQAQRVNGISYQMVRDEPSFASERETIQKIIDDADVIIGYNVGFDMDFLESNLIEFGDQFISDVMFEFAEFYGEPDYYHCDCRWKSLVFAADYTDYKEYNAHDAFEDCKATLHVMRYIDDHPNEHPYESIENSSN